MRLSVVIATKGRPEPLRETLGSLARCRPSPAELVIVDGDPARSAEPVVEGAVLDGVAVRYEVSPPGLTIQRNRGMEATSGDIVVFVDDDVEFDPGIFAVLEEAYGDASVVGVTGRVVERGERRFGNKDSTVRRLLFGRGAEGSMSAFGYPRRLQDLDAARDVEFMQGCLMTARRSEALRLRFDERLAGYALAEDEDFSYRLSRVGRIRYLPAAVVEHKNTGFKTTGTRGFNRMVAVNRAYLFRKNFRRTPRTRTQFGLLMLMLAAHRGVNGEWEGVRGLAEGSLQAWREGRSAR